MIVFDKLVIYKKSNFFYGQVMEQCVARLDVAMFNAILRESALEMPTDPVSDPIIESRVLPIAAGNLSFGSGAQLKNAVFIYTLIQLIFLKENDTNLCVFRLAIGLDGFLTGSKSTLRMSILRVMKVEAVTSNAFIS